MQTFSATCLIVNCANPYHMCIVANNFNVGIIVCRAHLVMKRVVVGVVCEHVDHELWSVPGVWSTRTEGVRSKCFHL